MKLHDEFKDDGFTVLGINVKESRSTIIKYMHRYTMTIPVLMDSDGVVEKQYRVRAHPEHFLVNRQGELIGKALGGRDWHDSRNRNLVRFLLSQDLYKTVSGRKQHREE